MEQAVNEAAESHLRELTRSAVLERAPVQAKALETMVRASLEGRELSGAELAQEVYGRADDNYVRAVRQLARELRLKLPLAYRPGEAYPIRFELHPHHYAVRIVTNAAGGAAASAVPFERNREYPLGMRVGIALVAATVSLGAIASIVWSGREAARLDVPARIEIDGAQISFTDASGRLIPGWRERLEEVSGFRFRGTPQNWPSRNWVQGVILESPRGEEPRLAVASCDPLVPGRCAVHLLGAADGRDLGRFELPRLPNGLPSAARLHEEDGETFVPTWSVSSIERADLDGDGVHDEIVVALYVGGVFPSQILGLDHDGSWHVLADYWNMGTARALALPDLDGDRRDEIVIYGENNSYQRAVLTLLPSAAGFPIGARSPDGYRLARLAEVASYPHAGVTLQFPFTDFAQHAPQRNLRNVVTRVAWDSAEAALLVSVLDAASCPSTREAWQLTFRLEAGPMPSNAFIREYDSALLSLQTLIVDGRIDDRWNLRSTQRLSDYGRDLASRILVWDARVPNAAWRPIRPDDLRSVFPRAVAPVTASAR